GAFWRKAGIGSTSFGRILRFAEDGGSGTLKLVIVTGMSGAGKTTALKILEDVGFYCVDNLPIRLIEKFAELVLSGADGRREVALGIDVRSGEELPLLKNILEGWRKQELPFSILFLDSSDEVLITP